MKFSIMCVCASVFVAGQAVAESVEGEHFQATLYYNKAELVTPTGAKENYKSLRQQAKAACEVETSYGDGVDYQCVDMIMADAIAKIESPILAAVHQGTELPFRLASTK